MPAPDQQVHLIEAPVPPDYGQHLAFDVGDIAGTDRATRPWPRGDRPDRGRPGLSGFPPRSGREHDRALPVGRAEEGELTQLCGRLVRRARCPACPSATSRSTNIPHPAASSDKRAGVYP